MVTFLIELIVIGVGLYLIEQIPMDSAIKTVIRVVAIIIALVLLLNFFGIATGVPALR